MSETPVVDTEVLRDQVREKYRAVAVEPDATYHFHTGRPRGAPAVYGCRRALPTELGAAGGYGSGTRRSVMIAPPL